MSGTVLATFRRTFKSLSNRNYRLFFIGQIVSTTGTWMQRVAQDWLIIELGGGPLELGIGVGLQASPALLLAMWGGVIADRADGRRVMLWTQGTLAALSLTLGMFTLAGSVNIPIVYGFAFVLGCADIIDKPSRHSYVTQMVPAAEVANAIGLNSSMHNASRLVGPAIAGVIIGISGSGVAFLINTATFVPIILALLLMDTSQLVPRKVAPRGAGQVIEGLRYGMQDVQLRPVLLSILIISTLAQNFRVLLPLFVADVFGGGAESYGLLMSALGLGALAGALACANVTFPTRRLLGIEATGFGLVLLVAALAPSYMILGMIMIGVGAGNTSFNSTSQSFALLASDEDKRGRAMAIRQMFSTGFNPIGTVLVAWICEMSSPRYGFATGGLAALVASSLLWRGRGSPVLEPTVGSRGP